MLFTAEQVEGIRAGRITLTFRRWKRPQARAGRFQRTGAGMIKVDSVDVVRPDDVSESDALQAGFAGRGQLLEWVGTADSVYRVAFHLEGSDSRAELQQALPDADQLDKIERRLRRMDSSGPRGAWILDTLEQIGRRPGTRAADLARELSVEKDLYKADVRRLKQLGLTISLERGYRLSPRGEVVLESLRSRRTANAQPAEPG